MLVGRQESRNPVVLRLSAKKNIFELAETPPLFRATNISHQSPYGSGKLHGENF